VPFWQARPDAPALADVVIPHKMKPQHDL